jgi:hypothetical protein
MANKVIIKFNEKLLRLEDKEYAELVAPLLEDVLIEMQTKYQRASEIIGSTFETIVTRFATAGTATQGTISRGMVDLLNAFSVPLYSGTEPVKLNLRLAFFTETDPKADVVDKVRVLTSFAIPSQNSKGSFDVPGVNLSTFRSVINAQKGSSPDMSALDNAKFISLKIPGIIFIPLGIILSVRPTFSRQMVLGKTGSKTYPLWCTVEVEIEGLYPADESLFLNT